MTRQPPLDSSEAQRLSRLRVLLSDTRRRVGDESELGLHVAVLAIDGVGELAIGLCLHKLGVRAKQSDSVPARLNRLLDKLKLDTSTPGVQGFLELHKMRNLVQHEGVLPAPDQVPRWLAETEKIADALVAASFGVDLSEIGSSAGVADRELQEKLGQAEKALEQGEAERSFDASWYALETARRQLRQKTGLHSGAGASGFSGVGEANRGLGALAKGFDELADQMELSAFTPEPGEWIWFRQRQGEKFRGLSPSLADAARAFAFVLSWVLRFESYIARHGVDRWERWEEKQRAPVTGVPGGPHIHAVHEGDSPSAPDGNIKGLRNWIFELTDIPEIANPGFDWAIGATSRAERSVVTHAYLDPVGRLSVTCPTSADPKDVVGSVRRLIVDAKAQLMKRSEEDAHDAEVSERILAPFRSALEKHGCQVSNLLVRMPRNRHRVIAMEAMVWIELVNTTDDHGSWFAKGLKETFENHFPEAPQPAPFDTGWNDLAVPATWDADRVARWICDATDFDVKKCEEESASVRTAEIESDRELSEMRHLIEAPTNSE